MSHRDNAEERPNTASFRQWGFVGIGETEQEEPTQGTVMEIDNTYNTNNNSNNINNDNNNNNTMNEDTTSTNSVHTMDIDLEESNSRKRKRSRSDEELRDEEETQEGEGEVSPRPLLKKYQDPGLTGNRPKEKKPMLCIRNLRAMLVVTGPTMNQGAEVSGSTQCFQWQ
jgi:hypothetical protein